MKFARNIILSALIMSMFAAMVPATALSSSADSSEETCIAIYGPYSDIKGGWFEKWVKSYGCTDIFSNEEGRFYPERSITRMEFARMLHNALNIEINYFAPTDISEYYNDVKSGDTGANELYDLVTCGIIDTKGSFGPSEKLDRDEMSHYIMNAFYYLSGEDYAIAVSDIKAFADDSEIREAYKNDIYRSAILGLVNGRGDGFVKPRGDATRAEAVTVAGRLAELVKEQKSNVVVKASAKEDKGELNLSVSIVNNTDKTVVIEHGYGQLFDFTIQDKNGEQLYHWAADKLFPMMIMWTKIAPGEEAVFSDKVEPEVYSCIKNEIAAVKAYITGTSSDFKINSEGYIVSDISLKAMS
ncbi:MAG: hypothetical protein GXY01_10995 [Clostridiales bacterium]|jgi:hypothetical protein|nr:hypothetical protein [Clostridiales bacterium]